jgi:hypothetical protein
MNIFGYGRMFEDSLARISPTAPEGTPLARTALEILEMADAYAADGRTFYQSGDPVNALASFAYGAGWRDAGMTLGFFPGGDAEQGLVPVRESIPVVLRAHLTEKTTRYRSMLARAHAAVVPAADRESPLHPAGIRILGCAKQYLEQGENALADGDELNALAAFSYGYGWLDAGVRAGLLQILQERSLFTV